MMVRESSRMAWFHVAMDVLDTLSGEWHSDSETVLARNERQAAKAAMRAFPRNTQVRIVFVESQRY